MPTPVKPRYPARKQRQIAAALYHVLVLPAVRNAFDRVALLDGSGSTGRGLSTIVYANHVSWWDGYMAFMLERLWQGEWYLMMEEAQLSRYRFWQRCGCFSVDRADAREAFRSVEYAAALLRSDTRRSVVIFPQGSITPNDRRPLVTYAGAAHVARRVGAVRGLPVALRFEFLGHQRPTAFIRVGSAHVVEGGSAQQIQAEMDERLLAEVDALRRDVVDDDPARYGTLIHGRKGVDVRWDELRRHVTHRS